MGTLLHPPAGELTEAQQAATDLRRLLRAMGTDDDVLRRVIPLDDLAGRAYVCLPPLPLQLVQRLVRLLPVPPEAER